MTAVLGGASMAPDVDALDLCVHAPPTAVPGPIGAAKGWIGAEVDPESCLVRFDDAATDELGQMVETMRSDPLPTLLRTPGTFECDRLRAIAGDARRRLDEEHGVAILDRLPMDALDTEAATAAFWVLGQLIGRPVAEKWNGAMLYDVRDTGDAFGYGVRGSWTNVELNFHNDNAFGMALPEYVGLLCINPAREGGVSRFCSLYAIHDRMHARHPALLERLYQPVFFDRQAEHGKGAPRVAAAPVFRYDSGRLDARANVSLIKKGYDVAGVAMDRALTDALDALESIATEPDLWFEAAIERGQMQYLNNLAVAHYRSEFQDHDDLARKRHLVRTWHRDRGRQTYDG